MRYDGRKSVKRHLRVTEDMDAEVRALAAIDHRPIGDQYRFLVDEALQILRLERNGQDAARRGELSPIDAEPVLAGGLPVSPKVANGRLLTPKRRTA